jgi:hypothetical protein
LWSVKALGRVDSVFRTEEQTRTALFWTDHDIPQWNRNLVRLAAARHLEPVQTARLLAMAHVAGGDAMIACFQAKYHDLYWRPVHAIQRANTDGNPLTVADPAWQPLRPTPNHPEYPSAHACHTTAVTEAMQSFFGTGHVPFSLDSLATGETHHYTRLKDIVKEVNLARVWAGFHYPGSDADGSALGRRVGRFVTQRFFRPNGCRPSELGRRPDEGVGAFSARTPPRRTRLPAVARRRAGRSADTRRRRRHRWRGCRRTARAWPWGRRSRPGEGSAGPFPADPRAP